MRIPAVVILAAAALAGTVPAASATVSSTFDGATRLLTVTSDAEGDTIVVSCPASALLVNGAAPPSGPLPCSGGGSAAAITLVGNGGVDTLDVSGLEELPLGEVTVEGGDGDDDIRGASLPSNGYIVTLLGGPGADAVTVNGADAVDGGAGDDRIIGSAAQGGTLAGGTGSDTFAFTLPPGTPVSLIFTLADSGMTIGAPGVPQTQTMPWTSIEVADLSLNEGAQTVDGSAFSGTARVAAGDGSDTLIGTAGADTLDGGAGNDFIEGLGGADVYQGGSGLDLLRARDGVADSGDCGSDEDTLVADPADALTGCERIDLPPPAPDTTEPVLGVERATLRGRRLRVPVSCPATEVRCAGVATLSAVGRRGGRRVRVPFGAVTLQVTGGETATLAKRLSRSRLRAVRRLKRVRLRIALDVVDASGNRTTGV